MLTIFKTDYDVVSSTFFISDVVGEPWVASVKNVIPFEREHLGVTVDNNHIEHADRLSGFK